MNINPVQSKVLDMGVATSIVHSLGIAMDTEWIREIASMCYVLFMCISCRKEPKRKSVGRAVRFGVAMSFLSLYLVKCKIPAPQVTILSHPSGEVRDQPEPCSFRRIHVFTALTRKHSLTQWLQELISNWMKGLEENWGLLPEDWGRWSVPLDNPSCSCS